MANEPYLKSPTFGLPDITTTIPGVGCPPGQLQVGVDILCDGLDCPPNGTCLSAEASDLSGRPPSETVLQWPGPVPPGGIDETPKGGLLQTAAYIGLVVAAILIGARRAR